MEPTLETQSPESPKSPESPEPPPSPKSRARCQARNRAGGQCRLHVQPPSGRLCARHAARDAQTINAQDDSIDLWDDIFADEESVLIDAENINKALTNVVTLVAKGRISSRRASAVSYALSLILRTVVIMDRQPAVTRPVFWDDPRLPQNNPQPPAIPESTNTTSPQPAFITKPIADLTPADRFEAARRYAQIRT